MVAISLTEFFERLFTLAHAAAEMFKRLAARLGRYPELSTMVRGLEEDQLSHLRALTHFRDSLPPAVLAGVCDEASVRHLGRVAALLEDDPAGRFSDFQEAYEFIHEFENNEIVPLLRLLERECRTEGLDCTPIMMIVEQHLVRLDAVAAAAGDRLQRRAIRL